MSWTVNNVATEDEYPPDEGPGAVLLTGVARRASITILNNAALISLKTEPRASIAGQALWQPELFVPPGSFAVVRVGLFGIRARSAAAGHPAFFTCQAVGADE